jgi:mRNA-degrading endonuclease toxin of MazEF toxin-antitoxin module
VKIGVSLPRELTSALERRETRLPKASVANLYDVQKVLRSDFLERVGVLPDERLGGVSSGLRLVLDLG